MRILSILFAAAALVAAGYLFWPEPSVSYPPGILAPDPPLQEAIAEPKPWKREEYDITPLARFRIKARVLHREKYGSGRESDLSPLDLALGWGRMSDQAVIDRIDFSQHSRWYFWRSKSLPIPSREIETESGNMHIIPATDEVESLLSDIRRGDVIELEGCLVEVRAPDGWRWKSSLSRTDTGNGACELVWVEQARILEPDIQP